jgi:hypothetical protein
MTAAAGSVWDVLDKKGDVIGQVWSQTFSGAIAICLRMGLVEGNFAVSPNFNSSTNQSKGVE